jgi:hypothetical protein
VVGAVLPVLNAPAGRIVDFHDTDDLTIEAVTGCTQDNAVFAATSGLATNNGGGVLTVKGTLVEIGGRTRPGCGARTGEAWRRTGWSISTTPTT